MIWKNLCLKLDNLRRKMKQRQLADIQIENEIMEEKLQTLGAKNDELIRNVKQADD